MKPGLIADIERASNHDGDGLRTVVFFKGCPLCCAWCHNPECINTEVQTLFYPEKCIHCGKCAQGCYSGARVVCGKQYTPKYRRTKRITAAAAALRFPAENRSCRKNSYLKR